MKISASIRLVVATLGLALCVSGCQHLPNNMTADLDRADKAAKAGDYATAVPQWQTLAGYGYTEAQLKLAQAYIKGNGVEQNPSLAVPLLEQAVAKNNPSAMLELGQLYEKGNGVEQDLDKAETLYLRTAAKKYPRGMFALGRFYERQKMPEKAAIYYKGAAALGVAAAQAKIEKTQ